jgi:alcohol dehydrogenase (NADP+)
MESFVDQGKCRAIGLSDVVLENLVPLYETARLKPAVVQVESHPYLPQTELLEFCGQKGIVLLAFAPLRHGTRPGPLEDLAVLAIARETSLTAAQVLIAWGSERAFQGTQHVWKGRSPRASVTSCSLLRYSPPKSFAIGSHVQ